ncbi:MAG: hypothetical protein ACKO4Z_14145 [Planctomycetota bacterium]
MRIAGFLAAEAVLLAAAAAIGGPAWAAVAAVACLALLCGGMQPGPLLAALPALAWPIGALATGNRELFFPFTMHLAAASFLASGTRGAGLLAGGSVVIAFLGVRVMQGASSRVLAVECCAAAAVVAAVATTHAWLATAGRDGNAAASLRWWLPVAAALLACGCLAL